MVGRGGPRDLAAIRDGLFAAADLAQRLATPCRDTGRNRSGRRGLAAPDARDRAASSRPRSPTNLPAFKRDGGFVRAGYDRNLDETRALRDESRRVVAALQARYADETQIRGLKIRHNNVLGYFVEVTAQHGDKLMAPPRNATFIHRQTLAGQVRFTTTELADLEAKIASAADRALGLELDIFEQLLSARDRRPPTTSRRPRRRSPCSMSRPRSRRSRSSAIMSGPRSIAAWISQSKAAAIRWSSRR